MNTINTTRFVFVTLSFAFLPQSLVQASDREREREELKRVLLTGIPTGHWTKAKVQVTQQIQQEAIGRRAEQLLRPFGRIYGKQVRLSQLHGSCSHNQVIQALDREKVIQQSLGDRVGIPTVELIISYETLTDDPCPIM